MRSNLPSLVGTVSAALMLLQGAIPQTGRAETQNEETLIELATKHLIPDSIDFEDKGYRKATFIEFFENVEKDKTDLREKDPGKEDPFRVDADKWNEDRTCT